MPKMTDANMNMRVEIVCNISYLDYWLRITLGILTVAYYLSIYNKFLLFLTAYRTATAGVLIELARFGAPGGHPFLGSAHGFVVAVNASDPAAGTAFALVHLIFHYSDVFGTRFRFGTGDSPADPLVARQRRNAVPYLRHLFVG